MWRRDGSRDRQRPGDEHTQTERARDRRGRGENLAGSEDPPGPVLGMHTEGPMVVGTR